MGMYCADFETTTDKKDCRVWAFAVCEIGNTGNFQHWNSIEGFFDFCSTGENHTLYFHNLKFDGEFIMCELFKRGFRHCIDRKQLQAKTFTTLISDMGQFYSLEIVFDKGDKTVKKVKLLDSMKLLNFSVDKVAKGFDLPISKLEIDYKEKREIGHKLTEHEIAYLKNDVTIMAMALNIMFSENLTRMTVGSNALHDFKSIVTAKKFEKWFPAPLYDHDIRQSYKGGFTYVNPIFQGLDVGEGIVLDVNSLYPSVMYYKKLPYGEGKYYEGKYKPDKVYDLYIQQFSCQFELKPNHIPTLQIKGDKRFAPTDYLESSNDEYVTLTLTSIDLELFLEHYEINNEEWHSGWKFKSTVGLFTDYIDKWNAIKVQASLDGNEARRTIAKLMLNSLYGKFSTNPKCRKKIPYYDNGIIHYRAGDEETRDPIYIPVGTFITSWARWVTITAAQSVYDRFLYADTDSLHLLGKELPPQLKIDITNLGEWKHEDTFRKARYLRQKTYVEDIILTKKKYDKLLADRVEGLYEEDGQHYHMKITCAGMPSKCYQYVTWENFHEGAEYKGKLKPHHVPGGIVLMDEGFSLNGKVNKNKKTIDKKKGKR